LGGKNMIYKGRYFKSKEVVSLQKKLDNIPLIPLNKSLRNKRDKLMKKIVVEAKKSGDINSIYLQGGL